MMLAMRAAASWQSRFRVLRHGRRDQQEAEGTE
jgi:hypothetical protein